MGPHLPGLIMSCHRRNSTHANSTSCTMNSEDAGAKYGYLPASYLRAAPPWLRRCLTPFQLAMLLAVLPHMQPASLRRLLSHNSEYNIQKHGHVILGFLKSLDSAKQHAQTYIKPMPSSQQL